MAKIFITGSSAGIGLLAAQQLINEGHKVVLHARNSKRALETVKVAPKAAGIVIGDFSITEDIISVAKQINNLGKFDAIIHNAGILSKDSHLTTMVNIVAPYILTNLINKPDRLIYTASRMHQGADLDIHNLEKVVDYSGSKLAVLLLMKFFSNHIPNVKINAVDPGWVPTKMGGSMANDNLVEGYLSQIWLAIGRDNQALQSGNYYYHKKLINYDNRVDSSILQSQLLLKLEKMTGIQLD